MQDVIRQKMMKLFTQKFKVKILTDEEGNIFPLNVHPFCPNKKTMSHSGQ